MKAYIFLAEGFEEIEAITPIDILRRADIETITVSVSDNKLVTGGRNITLIADCLFAEISIENTDYIILPGGMPGTDNLMAHEGLNKVIKKHYDAGSELAAICAAPSVFGKLGLLEGKEAISYPGYEKNLTGAKLSTHTVVKAENIITAKGIGVAIPFALRIVETVKGKKLADKIAHDICFEK